jgi:hypothetical protein
MTAIEIGLEVVLAIPSAIGSAVARSTTEPRTDGFQEQVTVKIEPEPIAVLFMHLGNTLPFTLKVTLEATVTVAVITTAELKVASVVPPANSNKVNAGGVESNVYVILI